MRSTVDILGVKVDFVTMNQALENIKAFLSEDKIHVIYTPNSEIMMDAQKYPDLKDLLNEADMLTADGAGVILASKILKTALPEKVSGFDLVKNSFSINFEKKPTYFFFGSKRGVAETAKSNVEKEFPGINVKGCRDGFFSDAEESEIINQINSSGADILLVALGAPKQEKWIHANRSNLKVRICIGVGGTLDVLAGVQTLAPDFFRRHGLEWFYRLIKEPGRFIRMLKLPKFIIRVTVRRIFK
jgi:N-acetylglucosaminyldiphosphoundecaprenol N-acetyl-beta-D-mannosaminyltransferase